MMMKDGEILLNYKSLAQTKTIMYGDGNTTTFTQASLFIFGPLSYITVLEQFIQTVAGQNNFW